MRVILNIIWLIFGGLWLALGYFAAGIICCILIITIPFGIASFRIGVYALWPFGKTVVRRGDAPVGERDRVELGPPPPPAFPAPLRLVHEDAHVVVVDKPAGLLTIASASERERTAYRLLRDWVAAQRRGDQVVKVLAAHLQHEPQGRPQAVTDVGRARLGGVDRLVGGDVGRGAVMIAGDGVETVVAIATDEPDVVSRQTGLPILDLNDRDAIADFILRHQGFRDA